jgi:hypothetical protein
VTGALNQSATGVKQLVPAAAGLHKTQIIMIAPSGSTEVLIEADVSVYYQGEPQSIPGVTATAPTKDSPATFQLVSGDKPYQVDSFYGLVNGNQPLVYSAAITTESGQILIDDQPIANSVPSIVVNESQRYFTLEITPGAIDWESAEFTSVSVLVTPTGIAGPGQPGEHPPLTWNKGEYGSQYITWSAKDTDNVSYTWQAAYCIPGKGTVMTDKAAGATDLLLPLPASPPAPASGPVESFATTAVLLASSASA